MRRRASLHQTSLRIEASLIGRRLPAAAVTLPYMVPSSFNAMPGIPVLHSKDLVSGEIVGHVYDRLPLERYEKPRGGSADFDWFRVTTEGTSAGGAAGAAREPEG